MLHQYEKLVLLALKDQRAFTVDEIAAHTKLNKDSVMRACYWLKEKGAVEIHEKTEEGYALTDEGTHFLKNKFPEQRVVEKAKHAPIPLSDLNEEEARVGLPWAVKNRWVSFIQKDGKKFIAITDEGKKAPAHEYALERALSSIADKNTAHADAGPLTELLKRGSVMKTEAKEITVTLVEKGRKLLADAGAREEINVLTKEMLTSGKWKEASLRQYDIDAPVEKAAPGKLHPLRALMNRISDIFSEMGFEEMGAGFVESSFWNFDALFQPQDHPARELADTFYLRAPERMPLPNKKIVEDVRRAHENGWKYEWSEKIAEQPVLRTHTTAVSARYLADIREGKRKSPSKFFCVGRVFRNEATDFKHLAEFYQVEGIVVWEKATFADLLGCLKEFYRKLGFEKIKFRPSYFPYTEPSVEVLVYFEEKKQWLELGGAGVFRPEVCLPLWGKYPVLAWGLSLERPAMMLMGLGDIRTFYKNNISWLRGAQVGRWR